MKEKLEKLIDVKSIMTLALTLVFCVLALSGVISGQEFITIFTVIVGFYFGTQVQKAATATTTVQHSTVLDTVAVKSENAPKVVDNAKAHKIHPPNIEGVKNE